MFVRPRNAKYPRGYRLDLCSNPTPFTSGLKVIIKKNSSGFFLLRIKKSCCTACEEECGRRDLILPIDLAVSMANGE